MIQLGNARPQVEAELSLLDESQLAREVLDLSRLQAIWKGFPDDARDASARTLEFRVILESGLMTGRFLRWFESGT
jgi:hypothetical protein